MDWKAEISAAQERIASHVVRTPVMEVEGFGLSFPVEMKLEQVQHAGSFKPRGAFNTVLQADVPEGGLVAVSGGNHGAAVAYVGAQLGHKVQVFVPDFASPAKLDVIRRLGGTVEVIPGALENVFAAEAAYKAETGALDIHPYDTPGTVAGQGTVFKEWEEQGLGADTVLIAVGGGGLIAGALGWFAGARRVVAVEPELAATLHTALAKGPDAVTRAQGVAASALGAQTAGRIVYDMARATGLQSVTVPDEAITEAQVALWRERRLLVEPGGATALAALICGAYRPAPGERVAVLLCGANTAPDPFA